MKRLEKRSFSIHFSISVVIMAFNESETLEHVVNEINLELTESGVNKYEIIVVDDGSYDGTENIVDHLEKKYPEVRVIHHGRNEGLGIVYRTGFINAKHDFITFYPADGQFPASNIRKFIPLMDNFDVILGYLPNRKSSMFSKFLSKMERALYYLAFGKIPRLQGIFMLRKKALDEIELKSHGRGWAIVMELIIKLSREGYRVVSIPTEMVPRTNGKSKVNNFKTIVASLKQIIVLYRYF